MGKPVVLLCSQHVGKKYKLTYLFLYSEQKGLKEKFIEDLGEVCKGLMISGNTKKLEGVSALYGVSQSIPDKTVAYELGVRYLDELYKTEHPTC